MTDKEAMKLALEALEKADRHCPVNTEAKVFVRLSITALKEALAQPDQEQQIKTLKRCLFQMQEAAKDLAERAKSLTPPQRTERFGWRKVQIDDAEEEAWRELEKKNDTTTN